MRVIRRSTIATALAALAAALVPWTAAAADAPSTLDTGDTAWLLIATALVMVMLPGLALFYGGLVRSKNVLSTIMHSFFGLALVSVVWVVVGFSIAFAPDATGLGLFGGLDFVLFNGVGLDPAPGSTVPFVLFAAFQMMFAAITPALITGAFAERKRFASFVIFTVLWSVLVYSPIAHWVWGGGLLGGAKGWLATTVGAPALDFAGGTVVHISAGVGALAFILFTGKRKGYPDAKILPNNLGYTVIGAGLLWFGWFGFNGGSASASNELATVAFTVTHIAAAAAAFSWAVTEWFHRGKSSVLGIASGLVAGLVCITPASGFVGPMSALIMGLIVSPLCYIFVTFLKPKLGYDDSLDVFGVHGIGGTVGAVCTGIFCEKKWNSAGADGLILGKFDQLQAQLVATAVTWVFAFVFTAVIVKLIDLTIGIRCRPEDEESGLDLTQHGEVGYNL